MNDRTPWVLGTETHTVLAVPAEEVHVAWLALPARNPVQARAAASAMLATQVAAAQDTLHVAIATDADDAGNRLVVGVDHAVMQRWLDEARSRDIEPDIVVPDCLLLPSPPPGDEGTLHVLQRDGRWLVRGAGLAFAADAALAEMLVGDRPLTMVDDDVLSRGAQSAPVNLLQGAYAREPDRPSPARRLRWLAAAVLLLPLVMPAASAARHAWAAHALGETARDEAAALLGTEVDDPLAATDARRQLLDARDTLPRTVAALTAAVAARPGTRVDTLHFSVADGLVAGVVHGGPADLAALDASLAEAGLALAILEERPAADGRQRTELRLESAQ